MGRGMMRQVPFNEWTHCDECGRLGAYDYMGDYLCEDCMKPYLNKDYNEKNM